MRIIYSLILSITFCLALSAQTVWTGSVDSDWMNPGNWSAGVPTTGMIVTVPGAPFGGNFPIYSGSPVLDFTLQNAGSITFDGFVYNNGTIINFSAGTLINNDNYFVNAGSVIFDNDGSFTNTGTFANFGVFDNAASAVFTNSNGASFINHGLYRNNGLLANNGSVTNYGTIRSTNNFQNNGIVENYGFIDSPFGSIIANNAESLISNFLGSIFTHNGSFQNDGTFENNGRLEVQNASTLTNDGTINNDNDLQISGTLLNNSTVTNNGVATINNGGTLDNKNNFANNNTVETATCAVIIQDSPIDISATVLHDGIIYELQGQVAEIVLDFGEVFNDLNQTKSPIAGCRSGAVVQLNENGTGTLDINLVDNGSFGSCGATIASRTLSRDQFTTNDLGDQTVTLTIEDNFGVISTCDAVIFVAEYVPPIEPVDDPNIEFACPGDITISPAQPGEPTVAVNWTEPEVQSTTCLSSPNPCTNDENIPGFLFMGEYNDSRYYRSNHIRTWTDANAYTSANGGFLAVISSQEENNFIRGGMGGVGLAWIGYTDEASEGNFEWVNGEATTYTNWLSGEPNNFGNIEHYVQLKRRDGGRWSDIPNHFKRYFIMEIPCSEPEPEPLPSCDDVSGNIPGFLFMGEYNDSKYYRSNHTRTWTSASAYTSANGGFLAAISSQEENNFIRGGMRGVGLAWIGYTDEASEGNFEWVNGEATTYTNWLSGEPNNFGNIEHYVQLKRRDGGRWSDIPNHFKRYFIMEIPCSTNNTPPSSNNESVVQQISGPPNGAGFGIGMTEVTYQVTDDCGNLEICTFTVTVEENPAEITATCPANIIVNAAPGANDAIVEWTEPTATTTCYRDGAEVTRIDEGPANGEAFPVGVSFVFYTIVDSCNNFQQCLLTITVNAQASALTLVSCPEDITTDANNFTWDLPTVSTTCFTGNIEINQIVGPDRGSTPAAGVHQIAYLINDDCGNSEVCIFNVTVCSEDGTNCTEALNFRATRDKRGVQTYWMTNTETQNDHFVVERSSDGVNFKPLLNVKSATNSSGAYNYFEADSNPFQGDNFYRLKKVHHDGSFDYSNVKRITFDLDLSATTVFPNPATNEVFIYLQDFEGKEATISVFNHLGQQMDVKVIDLIESYPIRFDLFKYSGGVYTMYIDIEGTKNFTRKFIISKL